MEKIRTFFKNSFYNHPILWTLAGIPFSLFLLACLTMWFFNIWTHHGDTTQVPEIVGMPLDKAVKILEEADLEFVISDSVSMDGKLPGSIVEVSPQPNSVVKGGREVYLTIVRFSPEMITLRRLTDDGINNVKSYLDSQGLRYNIEYVPSEYPDLVINAKYNGHLLGNSSKVPRGAVITLEVGRKFEPVVSNPLDAMIDAATIMDFDSEDGEASYFNEPDYGSEDF